MFRYPLVACLSASLFGMAIQPAVVRAEFEESPPKPTPQSVLTKSTQPVIQLAILLDTSGSMEGLMTQARAKVWDVVNHLTLARKNSTRPTLQIALYQYGSDKLPASENFMRCVQPFTTDLDLISERLFSLQVAGSAEYCGTVLKSGLDQLSWDQTPAAAPLGELPLRMVIIAGNEEFTQGPIAYEPIAKRAKSSGIFVNTVYCGSYAEGEKSGWLNAAYLSGGSYNAIDTSTALPEIATPQDAEILRLNTELNATYIAYGTRGQDKKMRQTAQDSQNQANSPASSVSRAVSKSGASYTNVSWDIVDYVNNGSDLATVPTTDLPEIMRPMTIDERRVHVAKLAAQRAEVQRKILELNKARDAFLAEDRKKTARADTLDSAIIKSIREQAGKVGFEFSKD